jgi:hypothetical protein
MLPAFIAGFACRAASLATGCKVKVDVLSGCYDLRQNKALGTFLATSIFWNSSEWLTDARTGDETANVVNARYGCIDYDYGISSASTDFVCSFLAVSNWPALWNSNCLREVSLMVFYIFYFIAFVTVIYNIPALPALHPGFGEHSF